MRSKCLDEKEEDEDDGNEDGRRRAFGFDEPGQTRSIYSPADALPGM